VPYPNPGVSEERYRSDAKSMQVFRMQIIKSFNNNAYYKLNIDLQTHFGKTTI